MNATKTNRSRGTIGCVAIFSLTILSLSAQTSSPTVQQTLPPPTPYSVVSRNANQNIWERTVYQQGPSGQVIPVDHRYTELASGLNYQDPATGAWIPSQEIIETYAGGAIARQGQYQVIFANNLNSRGAIDMQTPDGKRLQSNILGLGYVDETTGQAVLIAQIQGSQGELISSNQVLYPNAFAGINADVRYTYKKGSFEQDVILREQLPDPTAYGLNPATTEVEVMTEFLNPPPAAVAAANGGDENVSWGATKLGRGKAFALDDANSPRAYLSVTRQYASLQGRNILLEKVPVSKLQASLQNLPIYTTAKLSSGIGTLASVLPAARSAQVSTNKIQIASTMKQSGGGASVLAGRESGYVLDYNLVNSYGPMDFQAGATYLVSGYVILEGLVTFEGGAVIKYEPGAAIQYGAGNGGTTVNWQTGPYDPAIFTSSSDNSVGEFIDDNPGGSYTALIPSDNSNVRVHDARICYAGVAIEVASALTTMSATNVQIVNCQVGFEFDWVYGIPLILTNCLIVSPNPTYSPASAVIIGGQSGPYTATATLYNCTIDNFSELWASNSDDYSTAGNIYITNSVISNIGDWGDGFVGGGGDAFETGTTPSPFGDDTQITCGTPYDVIGGGNYYIDASLGANAKPVDEAGDTIAGDATLGPQPYVTTLGYNYPRIDYLLSGSRISGGNVTVEPGTVIAVEGYGVKVAAPVTLNFAGTAASPCYLIEGNMVQENGAAVRGIYGWSSDANWPVINANFTKFYSAGNDLVFAYQSTLNANYVNCEFYGGSFGGAISGITAAQGVNLQFNNCLLDGNSLSIWGQNSGAGITNSIQVQNCTLYNDAYFRMNANSHFSKVTFQNNAIDGVTAYRIYIIAHTNIVFCSSNAYRSGPPLLTDTSALTNVSDFNWQHGPLGNFYLPTNSPLIDAGDITADQVGLYHFTTQTNQIPETNSTVDIGYHYVAVNADGNPLDADGEGIPDYIEDANGDGIYDSGDLSDWRDYYNGTLPNLTIISGNYQCGAPDSLLPIALSVRVTNGGIALTNAPLVFTVTQGGLKISTNGPTANSIALRSDSNGMAFIYYVLPATTNADCFVNVTAYSGSNSNSVVFKEHTLIPTISAKIGDTALYLKSNGHVMAWGESGLGGAAGDDDITNIPVEIPGLSNIVEVSATYHSLALSADGTVYAWGENMDGELGTNAAPSRDVIHPVIVPGLTNVIKIAAGSYNSLALESDGSVWEWGYNGIDDDITNPTLIITGAIEISGGDSHNLALLTNGTVWGWGYNGDGELGDGTYDDTLTPVQMLNVSNVIQIAAGVSDSLMLESNGIVWATGDNVYGELGIGQAAYDSGFYWTNAPMQALGLSDVVQIAIGSDFCLASDSSGNAWAWGRGNSGQMGQGTTSTYYQPIKVKNLSQITEVAAGNGFSVAVDSMGRIFTWGGGSDDPEDLGYGNTPTSNKLDSSLPNPAYFYPVEPVIQILQGNSQTGNFLDTNFSQSLVIKITDGNNQILTNAPVYLQVVQGDLLLSTNQDSAQYPDMRLDTDPSGELEFFIHPSGVANTNCIIDVYAAWPNGGLGVDTNFDAIFSVPQIQITGGDYQTNSTGTFLPVTAQLTSPLPSSVASLQTIVSVASGGVQLAATTNDIPGTSLTLAIDSTGLTSFWVYFPTNVAIPDFLNDSISVQMGSGNNYVQTNFNPNVIGSIVGTYWFGLPDDVVNFNGALAAWEMHYFGYYGMDPLADFDNDGTNNLMEFINGTDPNDITFSFHLDSQDVDTNIITGAVTVIAGLPSSYSVLVDNTNFGSATWAAYSSSNITVNLGSLNGQHDVWIGLRGLPTDAHQTWVETTVVLDSELPSIVITNPADGASVNSTRMDVLGNFSVGTLKQISVNGVSAFVTGTNFDARNVPLSAGTNVITAVVENYAGITNAASITIIGLTNTDGSMNDPVQLSATPVVGISPLAVTFEITSNSTSGTLQHVFYDFNGDDIADFTTNNFDSFVYTYATNGVYFPVVTIQTTSGSFSSSGGWNSSDPNHLQITAESAPTQTTLTTVTDPVDLKWDGSHLYVLSGSTATITEFDSSGTAINSINNLGINPTGFDVDANGNIYVAITSSNQVWKFIPDSGSYIADTNFGFGGFIGATNAATGTANGEFNAPYDVAVSPDGGTISVSDSGNNRIQQFSTNGLFAAVYGTTGVGIGQFESPKGLNYDDTGNLYIVDAGNNRIALAQGTTVSEVTGAYGNALGQFDNPIGINPSTRSIYVADTGNNRIQSFIPSIPFNASQATLRFVVSGFNQPAAIAAVQTFTNEMFYVADTGNNRVVLCNATNSNLDAVQTVWNNMTSHVTTGDIDGALSSFSVISQDDYRQTFLSIGKANVISAINQIGALSPSYVDDEQAEYYFTNIIDGQTLTFPVKFDLENGVWKILEF